MVGTPGVDTSGAQIASSIAGAAQTAMKVFGEKALQKKQIQDNALANKALVDFDVQLEKSYIEHQNTYKTDPANKSAFLKDNAEKMLQGFADQATSPEVRAAIEQNGYKRIGEKLVGEAQWAEKQTTQNTIDATVSANDVLASEAYLAGVKKDVNRLNEVFRQADAGVKSASAVLGADDVQRLKKSVRIGAINGLMETDPAFLHEVLRGEAFKDVLSPDEVKKLKADALVAVKSQKEKVEMETFVSQISENQEHFDRYLNGTETYADIATIEDESFAAVLNDLRLKGRPYTPEERMVEGMQLYTEVVELIKGKGANAYSKGNLEQTVKLHSKILGAYRDARISAEQAKSMLDKFGVPTQKALKDSQEWWTVLDGYTKPFQRAYEGVVADGKRYNLPAPVQANILVEFDQQLALMEATENPTAEQVDAAYDAAYKSVVRKYDPRLLKSQVVTNAVGSKNEGVQPIYGGNAPVKADRTIAPPKPETPTFTEADWAFTAKKYGITVEEAKKRAGVQTDNG